MMTFFNIFQGALTPSALYADPQAISTTITSLAGIIIALSSMALVFWRSITKIFCEAFRIDSRLGGEREEELVINKLPDHKDINVRY